MESKNKKEELEIRKASSYDINFPDNKYLENSDKQRIQKAVTFPASSTLSTVASDVFHVIVTSFASVGSTFAVTVVSSPTFTLSTHFLTSDFSCLYQKVLLPSAFSCAF